MARGGSKEQNKAQERRCIVSREVGPKGGLIRFVLDPSGVVTPDVTEKLPGRGLWVSAKRAVIEEAAKKNAFSRAAKAKAIVPEGLADLVESLVAKRLVDALSLARKAGLAIGGFDKVKSSLLEGRARALFQASDGSPDQKRKLRPPPGKDAFYDQLTADELGLAFGREHVIHAVLLAGGMTPSVRMAANRLIGLRADPKLRPAKRAGQKG